MLFFAYFKSIYFKLIGSFLAGSSINLTVRATWQLPSSDVNWASKTKFIFKIRALGWLCLHTVQRLEERYWRTSSSSMGNQCIPFPLHMLDSLCSKGTRWWASSWGFEASWCAFIKHISALIQKCRLFHDWIKRAETKKYGIVYFFKHGRVLKHSFLLLHRNSIWCFSHFFWKRKKMCLSVSLSGVHVAKAPEVSILLLLLLSPCWNKRQKVSLPPPGYEKRKQCISPPLFLQHTWTFPTGAAAPLSLGSLRVTGFWGQKGQGVVTQLSKGRCLSRSYPWAINGETTVALLSQYRDIRAILPDAMPLLRQLRGALMHA